MHARDKRGEQERRVCEGAPQGALPGCKTKHTITQTWAASMAACCSLSSASKMVSARAARARFLVSYRASGGASKRLRHRYIGTGNGNQRSEGMMRLEVMDVVGGGW
jgi:hypothetical protein